MYKKRVEFWVCFALAFALVFIGWAQLARASVQQLNDSVLAANSGSNPSQILNHNLSGDFSSLTVHFENLTGPCGAELWLEWYSIPPTSFRGPGYLGEKLGANKSCTSVSSITWTAADFSGTTTFNPDYHYQLLFYQLGRKMKGAGTDVYPGGLFYYNGVNFYTDANVADIYFDLQGIFPPQDSISITSPVSTSTPIWDFSSWTVSFTQATSTTATSSNFYIKQIYIGATSTALNSLGGGTSLPPTILPSPALISKPFALDLGTWYAQAQMRYFKDIYDTGTLRATSSVISFTITGFGGGASGGYGASGGWATPTSTEPVASSTITCDPNSGVFASSLCFLANALFVPSSAATAQFQGIGDLVSSKPPLGYFSQIKTALSGIATTTTSTFALADLSSMSTTLTTPIKTVIQLILWFVFGFWIFNRIRHFEL